MIERRVPWQHPSLPVGPKDPVRVRAGKAGMAKRWGPPRIIRLDGFAPDEREEIVAEVEAIKFRILSRRSPTD